MNHLEGRWRTGGEDAPLAVTTMAADLESADVDRGSVLGQAGKYRAEAYDERLNDDLRGSSFLLAEAMRPIPEGGAEYGARS